ncbi:PRC-barrel domain-containing protein [Miltoncostaea oceani]|uniref:PRC-barrel domain-containing protein n=1 Tax=Miltoncostaea oceani TaxID=2843216 RepID=UPI001C3E5F01|nr:PRC-barrel domain-containing protein [Miltoncostaea oceani]
MSVLMRAREITGRPVVTRDGGEAIAEVKDVVIAHGSASLVGFTLNKRGFLGSPLKEVLPWSAVGALGRDAVMIDGGALVASDPVMDAASAEARERDVIGATVMTDAGTALGTVVDVIVEVGDDASIVGFEVDGPDVARDRTAATLLIPVDDTIAVSGTTLMVPAATEQFVHDDLSGFGSAVADFRARLKEGTS